VEESNRDVIRGAILEFSRKYWRKSWKTKTKQIPSEAFNSKDRSWSSLRQRY